MKGHVYKRGKTWYYRFDIEPDPLTGKRRQANGSGYTTEREAWKACRDAMADHEKGHAVRSARRKVADALEEWLTRIEHSVKTVDRRRDWRNYAKYYAVPYIGERDLKEIDGGVCDALYAKLLAEGRVKAKAKGPRPSQQQSRPSTPRRVEQERQGSVVPPVPVRRNALLPQARRRRSPSLGQPIEPSKKKSFNGL